MPEKTLFWARLRKDVGTRAALEWWLGSAATEEQISNWEKAHRALMPAHLIVQRLQSEEYEAVGWEVENGGDSAVRRACWYMAGMLPYTADWGTVLPKVAGLCARRFAPAHFSGGYAASDGTGGNRTAAPGAGFILHGQNSAGTLGTRRGCRAAPDRGASDGRAGRAVMERGRL